MRTKVTKSFLDNSLSSSSKNSSVPDLGARLRDYPVIKNHDSYCTADTDMARAKSFTSEEERTRHARYTITIHDNTDSESMAMSKHYQSLLSQNNNFRETSGDSPSDEVSAPTPSTLMQPISATSVTSCESNDYGYISATSSEEITDEYEQYIKEKTTVFGLFMSCLYPAIPGESDFGMESSSARSHHVLAALKSEEDALDKMFNNKKGVACCDDTNISSYGRDNIDRAKNPKPLPTTKGRDSSDKTKGGRRQDMDIIDNVFEGVESFACQQQDHGRLESSQPDLLDNVFEQVEKIGCQDDYEDERLQQVYAITRARTFTKSSRNVLATPTENGDTLAIFCQRFERAVCRDPDLVRFSNKADLLDDLCEGLERTACAGSVGSRAIVNVNAAGVGDEQAPIDLTACDTYSLGGKNSMLVDSPSVDSRESIGLDRRTKRQGGRNVNSSPKNKIPLKSKIPPKQIKQVDQQDMLDYVFENMESAVCRQDGREHLRGLSRIERIRAEQNEKERFLEARAKRRVYE